MSRLSNNRLQYLNPDQSSQTHSSHSSSYPHSSYPDESYRQRSQQHLDHSRYTPRSRVHSSDNADFDELNPDSYYYAQHSRQDEMEQNLENSALEEAKEEKEQEKKGILQNRIGSIALIVACVYIIVLIYGVFCTSFMYDKSGKIRPQVLTVSQIKDKKTFDGVMIYYNDCKLMYKEILKADYNASLTVGDNAEYTQAEVSKQYSDLLKTSKVINAQKLSTRLHAAADDNRFGAYAPVLGAMYQWATNYVPEYLTDAAKYLTGDSTQELSNTVISLQTVLNDRFTSITQTMAGYADGKAGVDISELQWNPTAYYKQLQEGKVGSKD